MDIAEIDAQHIAMTRQLNRIVEEFNASDGTATTSSELDRLLSGFLEQAREHFECEESQMRRLDYPGYHHHHNEHAMLLAELSQLVRDIKRDPGMLDMDTLIALKYWFVAHLVGADKAYARFYHEHTH